MPQSSYSPVTTLKKALVILEVLADKQRMRPVELAQNTGLTRSNVNRLLATLHEMGYVESRDGKSYQLGYKVFVIGNSVPRRNQLTAIAYPHLAHLAEICQENVNLAILHNKKVLYIDKVESPHYVKFDRDIGTTDPVHCTALGKVLLSRLSDLELASFASFIDTQPRTRNTITDPNEFIASVKKARCDGYATDLGELSEEIRCVAAPIIDRDERVIAGISISAPSMRMPPQRMLELRDSILKATLELSRAMGYAP